MDWNAGAVGDLAEYSYGLHADLAREFGAERLGYRSVSTLAVSLSARPGDFPCLNSSTFHYKPYACGIQQKYL